MHRIILILLSLLTLVTVARADALKYTIVPNFFEPPPDHQPLGPCHGGALIDKTGNIYVSTDTPRGVVVFSPAGKFLRTQGPTRIHGMELREEKGEEFIYGARPTDHEVIKLRLTGDTVWTIGFPKECGIYKDANEFKPCAVTVTLGILVVISPLLHRLVLEVINKC